MFETLFWRFLSFNNWSLKLINYAFRKNLTIQREKRVKIKKYEQFITLEKNKRGEKNNENVEVIPCLACHRNRYRMRKMKLTTVWLVRSNLMICVPSKWKELVANRRMKMDWLAV